MFCLYAVILVYWVHGQRALREESVMVLFAACLFTLVSAYWSIQAVAT